MRSLRAGSFSGKVFATKGFSSRKAPSRADDNVSRISAQLDAIRQRSEQKLQVARKFYEEGWSSSNLESLNAMVAEDHVQEDQVWQPGTPRHGRDSLKKGIAFIRKCYPDVRFKVNHAALTDEGQRAFVKWTMTGTFEGQSDKAFGMALLTINGDNLITRTEVFRQATRAEIVLASRSDRGPVAQSVLMGGQ